MVDGGKMFPWTILCTQFCWTCLHTEKPYHMVRRLWSTGCEKCVEGSSNGSVSVTVILQGPRRERLMWGYNKVHVTDKFEYLNVWPIFSDPCRCTEQLDLTSKPTNEHKGMKVFYTHTVLSTCFHNIFMYQCFVTYLPEDSYICGWNT
jgi:hypothetical protein